MEKTHLFFIVMRCWVANVGIFFLLFLAGFDTVISALKQISFMTIGWSTIEHRFIVGWDILLIFVFKVDLGVPLLGFRKIMDLLLQIEDFFLQMFVFFLNLNVGCLNSRGLLWKLLHYFIQRTNLHLQFFYFLYFRLFELIFLEVLLKSFRLLEICCVVDAALFWQLRVEFHLFFIELESSSDLFA